MFFGLAIWIEELMARRMEPSTGPVAIARARAKARAAWTDNHPGGGDREDRTAIVIIRTPESVPPAPPR